MGSSNLTEGGFRHAFVWRDGVMSDIGTPGVESEATSHGVLTELGNLGAQKAEATGIGLRTLIVGTLVQDPFDEFGTQDAWVGENGVLALLPELSGGNSSALGVNRRGEIVGSSQIASQGSFVSHAVLWHR